LADHFPESALHTFLKAERGGTKMLLSEKVLLIVAGPMATLMAIAALIMNVL